MNIWYRRTPFSNGCLKQKQVAALPATPSTLTHWTVLLLRHKRLVNKEVWFVFSWQHRRCWHRWNCWWCSGENDLLCRTSGSQLQPPSQKLGFTLSCCGVVTVYQQNRRRDLWLLLSLKWRMWVFPTNRLWSGCGTRVSSASSVGSCRLINQPVQDLGSAGR